MQTIVVGIWNNGAKRHAEYFPQKALTFIPEKIRDSLIVNYLKYPPRADHYLRFIVNELKPFIYGSFATHPGQRHLFLQI